MDEWGDIYGVDREERAERLRNGIIPPTVENGAMTVRLRIANPEIPQDFPTIRQSERFGIGNIPAALQFPIPEREVFHMTNQTRYIETIMYANRESEHLFIRSQRYGEPNFSVFENRKYYVVTLNTTIENIITFEQAYDTIACTCDDFYYRSGAFENNLDPEFKCKHMLAIEYALENSQQYREDTEEWQNVDVGFEYDEEPLDEDYFANEDEEEQQEEDNEDGQEEEVVEEPEAPVTRAETERQRRENQGIGERVRERRSTRQRKSTRDPDFDYSGSKMNDTDEDFLVNVFKLLKIKGKNKN